MSELSAAIAAHRARIRRIDRAALGTLEAAYQGIADQLAPLIELLARQIETEGAATPTELFRLSRYQELQRQLADELERLALLTGRTTEAAQRAAVQVALTDAATLATASAAGAQATASVAAGWTYLNTAAVEDLIGATSSGPVRELLASFGDDGMRAITDELVKGLGLGESPRSVARRIESGLNISRNRALTISRTEMLRSYRSATLRNYRANDDILSGWIWTSAHSARTCAACLAMDGTEHPMSATMDSHPACRCAMRPWLKSVPQVEHQTGEEWLATQPVDVQDAILGKSGGDAYRSGEVALRDFVRVDDDPRWGKSVRDGGIGWARMQAGQERRAA